MMTNASRVAYLSARANEIETALSAATGAAIEHEASDPISFIAERLLQRGARSSPSATPRKKDGWRVGKWMASTEAAAILGRALLPAGLDDTPEAELAAARELGHRHDCRLQLRMRLSAALDELADHLVAPLRRLAEGEAATELQAKFSQGAVLEYSGLNAFFGGLEAKVGAPSPKVRKAMAAEHTSRGDSHDAFTTKNYQMTTTSETEWRFVAEPDAPPAGGWPVEPKLVRVWNERRQQSAHQLTRQPTRTTQAPLESGARPREPMPLEELEAQLETPQLNGKLQQMKEPEVVLEEAIGARLYTGVSAPLSNLPQPPLFPWRPPLLPCCCSRRDFLFPSRGLQTTRPHHRPSCSPSSSSTMPCCAASTPPCPSCAT